jgi:hypothetical protein
MSLMVRAPRFLGALACLVVLSVSSAPVHAQSVSPNLRGSNTGVLGPISLHAGLAIVHAQSNGGQNFAADLISQDPSKAVSVLQDPQNGFKAYYSLMNLAGSYKGSVAVMLPADDTYYIWVTLASGPYQFSVEQPVPDSVTPVAQTSFSGKSLQVTPVFDLAAGTYTVSAQSSSTSLRVWLYSIDDLGGAAVTAPTSVYSPDNRLIDSETGSPTPGSAASVSVTVPQTGPYLMYVDAEGAGPANWSISVQ